MLGLLAVFLASCGPSAPGQQSTLMAATAGPTRHATGPNGRIVWQGFLDSDQTTAAIFSTLFFEFKKVKRSTQSIDLSANFTVRMCIHTVGEVWRNASN
jgi:hypothetical protein